MSVKYPPDWFSSGMVEVGTHRSPCTHHGHSEGGHGRGGSGRRQVMVTRSPAEMIISRVLEAVTFLGSLNY